jgi:hypothetical protein
MTSDRRTDVAIISASACVAVLAILTAAVHISPALRLFAAIGGILLGPGGLLYRLATRSRWVECLSVGVGINVAVLMVLALFAVSVHLWHPVRLELLIPLTTLLLAIVLFRRKEPIGSSGIGQATRVSEGELRGHSRWASTRRSTGLYRGEHCSYRRRVHPADRRSAPVGILATRADYLHSRSVHIRRAHSGSIY